MAHLIKRNVLHELTNAGNSVSQTLFKDNVKLAQRLEYVNEEI